MLKKLLKRRARQSGLNSLSNAAYTMLKPPPGAGKFEGSPDMLFIWIPKTAGTSVFRFLNKELGMQELKSGNHALGFPNRGAVTFGHMHYLSLLHFGIVTDAFHQRAFKFTFVRDPYARVASLYNYLTRRTLLDGQGFDAFLERVYRRPPVGTFNRVGLSQTNPQTDWLIGEDGELLVDRVFKVEELEAFSRCVHAKYGVAFNPTQRLNASAPVVTVDDIVTNAERTDRINTLYARDFDMLGYPRAVAP